MKGFKRYMSMILTCLTLSALLAGQAAAASNTGGEYRINTEHWSRKDFSQEANPAVFTNVFDRELYNTIRQTIVDGSSENPAYTMLPKADYGMVKSVLERMSGTLCYEYYVPDNFMNYYEYLDYFAVSAGMPENYQAALDFIQPVIQVVKQLPSDREKVEYLNDYLRGLLAYNAKAVCVIPQTFAPHSGELEAACASYAYDFNFLCTSAGIPCITIRTKTHTWNLVYVDEQWLHVDVSSNDHAGRNHILLTESLPNRTDTAPEATEFLKELLVPASTK